MELMLPPKLLFKKNYVVTDQAKFPTVAKRATIKECNNKRVSTKRKLTSIPTSPRMIKS